MGTKAPYKKKNSNERNKKRRIGNRKKIKRQQI